MPSPHTCVQDLSTECLETMPSFLGSAFTKFFPWHTPRDAVGIDIGSFSTKVVQLHYASERAFLVTYGEAIHAQHITPKEARGNGMLRYLDDDLAQLIARLLQEARVTTKNAVFSIPSQNSFLTSISFPKLDPKELERAIEFEASKYIPIPLAEVVIDWETLPVQTENQQTTVLLAAIPRDVIEKIIRITTLTNLTLDAIELEASAMASALIARSPLPTAILNIGHQASVLTVVDKGIVRMAYTLNEGSGKLTKALEAGLGVNEERAEAVKRDIGLSERPEEQEIASIMIPFVETLLYEVERILQIYHRTAPRRIQKINLTGGGTHLRGLIEITASRLGMEVTRGNAFARIVAPALMQTLLREISPSFSTAIGLTLSALTPQSSN
ncbi:MAG: type IV pilus assembly protein PilM [Parcubacteria group bacterium Gr01-1014_66]|nr:MAG: type IV pilus assembly protein PilM [Parcubacteria group bacterium Gr01-1014_66]